jgi:hypothetical protein
MKSIYKFSLPLDDQFVLAMPSGAKILSVQVQNDQPCIWAIVDPAEPPEPRCFEMYGTGHTLPEDITALKFIGTFQLEIPGLVFHLFEGGAA